MNRLSLDQLGIMLSAGPAAKTCAAPFFTSSNPITERPSSTISKASDRPSGDHLGVPTGHPLPENSETAPEPSALQSQISETPERSDTNAIFAPSGEYC